MKKACYSFWFVMIISVMFVQQADAQGRSNSKKKHQNRFNAGLVLGTNLSQN